MKWKEFSIIDFLFYKYYRITKFLNNVIPILSGIAVVTMIFYLSFLWFLFFIIKKYALVVSLEKWHVIAIGVILIAVFLSYFYHKKRYQQIIDRYKTLGKATEIITDILAVLGLIVFFILFVTHAPRKGLN